MTIRFVGCALAAIALSACGNSPPARSSAPPPSPTQPAPSTAAVVESLSSATGDGELAAATATAYLHGVVTRDWTTVCVTRVRAEQAEMARLGGTCERTMEKLFANQPVDLFATAAIGNIRKRAATIAVDVMQPGQTKPAMTLLLRQEDARWLLVDLPDSDEF
jgi:hypothetical protein